MDLINKKLVVSNNTLTNKEKALEFIADAFSKAAGVDSAAVVKSLQAREDEISTGLENGIAIPHAVVKGIKEPQILVAKFSKGVKWQTLDNSDVEVAIAIFVPEGARDEHLRLLGKVSTFLGTKEDQDQFKKRNDDEIIEAINSLEVKKAKTFNGKFDIVGVTSCPTGVAHTFMAAEMLEKEAKARGLTIKIEKRGQQTVDALTPKEIEGAKYVIFSTGKAIDESKFAGKEVYREAISKTIKDAKTSIDNLIDGSKAEVIASSVKSTGGAQLFSLEATMDFNNFGRRCWDAVLNGVSHMLPFVVVGGILVAMSFMIDTFAGNADAEGAFGSVNPFAAWMGTFGHVTFDLMVPIFTAYLVYSICGRQGLIIGFAVGFLAAGSGPNWIEVFSYNGWYPTFLGDVNAATPASGIVGGIIGGIGAAALVILCDNLWNKVLPQSLMGAKLILILPFTVVVIGGTLFWFVNIPLTFITWGLLAFLNLFNDHWYMMIIFGLVAGAMACVDYGGPVNKAAYVFGTVTLGLPGVAEAGGSVYMASVSAACILPPLGIALATCFGRGTLWDESDISAGYTNWILGSTHITEGAIPFATKYPKDVYLQTMLVGSIVAALAGGLGIATMAPHGGVLTFALLKCTLFSDPTLQIVFGITLYLLILAFGICLQAFLIVMSRKRTVRKEAEGIA